MPSDAGDKTEQPTPRRLQDARERGQVAKSMDLSAAVTLLAAVVTLNFMLPIIMVKWGMMVRAALEQFGDVGPANDSALAGAAQGLIVTVTTALPVMLVLALSALVVNVGQVGFLFTFQPLTPSWSKINPVAGFQRLFSMRNAVRALLSIAKIAIISAVAYLTIRSKLAQIATSVYLDQRDLLVFGGQLLFALALRLALVLLILAILDYIWNRYKHVQDLKMTKQEVKEEMRRMEGDPVVKQRRRRVQMQLTMQRMNIDVPKADVVITNPTELAIAIRYDAETMTAPKVVAKGAGFLAARIRQIAVQHGVPVVERKPLARAMYRAVDVGQEVPAQFYRAIAEILAYVYRLTGRRPASAGA